MSNAQLAPTYQSDTPSDRFGGGNAMAAARSAGMAFLSSLATELSGGTVDLPCFPEIVVRVRQALDNPKMKPEEAVTIVGAEPRLAAKLLHIANSAAFNPSGKPLADLRSAITRLGYQQVQSATMAFAIQQMKNAESLRGIAQPLSELWKQSIAVASIAQVVARRTKVRPDEAFLTGLLHGIGRLYIMVRATRQASLTENEAFMDLVSGWHAGIGKAVIENWGFAETMAEAIGMQRDYDAQHKHAATLSDILIVSVVLSDLLQEPLPRVLDTSGIFAFQSVGLTEADCAAVLTHAQYQLGALHEALGC